MGGGMGGGMGGASLESASSKHMHINWCELASVKLNCDCFTQDSHGSCAQSPDNEFGRSCNNLVVSERLLFMSET